MPSEPKGGNLVRPRPLPGLPPVLPAMPSKKKGVEVKRTVIQPTKKYITKKYEDLRSNYSTG